MKWFFRITALIILVFLGLAIAGFFAPSMIVVERDITIEAAPEDVFPFLDDLELSNQWSPWAARNPDADYVFSHSESGVGAHVIWRDQGNTDTNAVISSQEIMVSESPEFVLIDLLLGGDPANTTYALSWSDDGSVLMYIKYERDVGGFPFLQRLFTSNEETSIGVECEAALQRLKALSET